MSVPLNLVDNDDDSVLIQICESYLKPMLSELKLNQLKVSHLLHIPYNLYHIKNLDLIKMRTGSVSYCHSWTYLIIFDKLNQSSDKSGIFFML